MCVKHYDRWKTKGSPHKTAFHVEKHGLVKHSLYPTWQNMRRRCHYRKATEYHNYGGRGIRVCKRWDNSFSTFLKDMGEKPSSKHTLDRIDNDGDYTPENCRWATQVEQRMNTRVRVDNTSGYKGVSWNKRRSKWRAFINIDGQRIELGYYKYKGDAIKMRITAKSLLTANESKIVQ